MPINLPNLLTWLRIVLIPLMVGVFYLPDGWITALEADLLAAAFFGVAAVTDWLDGYLARKLGQTSAVGAFLDPVADKLMVAAALIVLVDLDRAAPLIAVIIIGREITISALRECRRKNAAVEAHPTIVCGLQACQACVVDDPYAGSSCKVSERELRDP